MGENMTDKKVKKPIGPNEASVGRWILMSICSLIVGSFIGVLLDKAVRALPILAEGSYLAPERDLLAGIMDFFGIFLAFAIFLRLICKTGMRDFLYGAGRRFDRKNVHIFGGLFAAGFVLSMLVDYKYTSFECDDLKLWFINAAICLLFLWIQTTTEELFFRGLFLRVPFGNKIPTFGKGMIAAALSSLVFMSLHLTNPEVTSKSGIDAVLIASTYFISGLCMFIPNLYIGGMEGGLIIHFINNFLCFTLVKQEITVMPTPTLFVDHLNESSGPNTLLTTLISYAPVLAFSLIMIARNNKKQKEEN